MPTSAIVSSFATSEPGVIRVCKVSTDAAAAPVAKTDAPASTIMKPGDVSPDKAVKVIELVDSAAADKAAWKGKEIIERFSIEREFVVGEMAEQPRIVLRGRQTLRVLVAEGGPELLGGDLGAGRLGDVLDGLGHE